MSLILVGFYCELACVLTLQSFINKHIKKIKRGKIYKYCVRNALRNGNLINIQVPWGFHYGIQDFHMIEILSTSNPHFV
jgi:lipopolysaccharide biosynthesis regulator YciM